MERAASQTRRIAVLTGGHGRGSNLGAIHEHFASLGFPARVELVVGDRRETPVKELCWELGLRYVYISSRDMPDYETRLLDLLNEQKIELIALGGFLKLLPADFLEKASLPVLNIHPALIPKYCGTGMYGMKVHQAVWVAGESYSGVTVHEVDPIYDHGRILAQQSVDISRCKTHEEIAALVLKIEHRIYAPTILKRLAEQS